MNLPIDRKIDSVGRPILQPVCQRMTLSVEQGQIPRFHIVWHRQFASIINLDKSVIHKRHNNSLTKFERDGPHPITIAVINQQFFRKPIIHQDLFVQPIQFHINDSKILVRFFTLIVDTTQIMPLLVENQNRSTLTIQYIESVIHHLHVEHTGHQRAVCGLQRHTTLNRFAGAPAPSKSLPKQYPDIQANFRHHFWEQNRNSTWLSHRTKRKGFRLID